MREVRKFLRSSARFVWVVTKRSVYGLFFLFLRWSDVYTSVIRTYIPDSWQANADSLMVLIDSGALWIAIAIIILSVLWTYWEVDREVRDPRTTRKLKSFYNDFAELIFREISSDDDFDILKKDHHAITKEITGWIGQNMDESSLARLRQKNRTGFQNFTFKRDDAFNDEHSALVDLIIDEQEGLALLIERTVWV